MKTYSQKKEEARETAREFLNTFSNENYTWSYGGLLQLQCYFEKVGKRYGLLREFRENGIL